MSKQPRSIRREKQDPSEEAYQKALRTDIEFWRLYAEWDYDNVMRYVRRINKDKK